jgi:hypothetical protein
MAMYEYENAWVMTAQLNEKRMVANFVCTRWCCVRIASITEKTHVRRVREWQFHHRTIGSVQTVKGGMTMPDREKVIKGLHCCSRTDDDNCCNCPYDVMDSDCSALMSMDVLELLKEQEAVVRCKDCIYLNADTGICIVGIPHGHKDTFYCSYGRRR